MSSGSDTTVGVIGATLLPARAVYLFPPGNSAAFRRAVQEATSRWGGATEPIIPVRRDGRFGKGWGQFVEFSKVDAAVSVDVDVAAARTAATRLGLPLVPLEHIDLSGPTRWTCHPAALLPPARIYTAGEFMIPSQHVGATPESPLWQAVAVGDMTREHDADYYNSEPHVLRMDDAYQAARAQISETTLLGLTLTHFAEHFTSGALGAAPAVIWLTTPNSLSDCLWFWNLRALRSLRFHRSPFIMLPEEAAEWPRFAEQLESVFRRPDEFSFDATVCSFSIKPDRVEDIASRLGLAETEQELTITMSDGPPNREPPYTYRLKYDPRAWVFFDRRYGERKEIPTVINGGKALVEWDTDIFTSAAPSFVRLDGAPFNYLPKRSSVAALINSSAIWVDRQLQFGTMGTGHYRFEISLPSVEQVTQTVLSTLGRAFSLSDKGKIGAALANSTDIAILLEPKLYEVVGKLTTLRSTRVIRELRRLRADEADEDLTEFVASLSGRAERRYASAANLGMSNTAEVRRALERLVAAGWAERGFETDCRTCGLKSFVPLVDQTAEATCPGCSSPSAYTDIGRGLSVFYRLNSLVDRASDQGVLPHLMVWAALRKRDPLTYILPGVNFGGPSSDEVDIAGIHNGTFIMGEVKTSPAEFSPRQLRRDFALTSSLQADLHILATPGEVDSSLRASAEALAVKHHVELVVLDHRDFQP